MPRDESTGTSSSSPPPMTATVGSTDPLVYGHNPTTITPLHFSDRAKTAIGASLSSLASTVVGFPLDSVKTRMQAYKFKSMWDCIRSTAHTEGLGGFFRGVTAPIFSVTAVRTTSFSLYQQAKFSYSLVLSRLTGGRIAIPSQLSPDLQRSQYQKALHSLPVHFLAGFTGGGLITFFACPFELCKLSQQIELLMWRTQRDSNPDNYPGETKYTPKGTIKTARDIYAKRGFLGLYAGFPYHFARDSLGTAFYFSTYESAKLIFSNLVGDSAATSSSPASAKVIALSGGLCGIVSWAIVFPIDTIKSMTQRDILTHGHARPRAPRPFMIMNRRLYRGLGVSILRTGLVNMTFFSLYEQIIKRLP